MFKHSGWVVAVLVKEKGAAIADPIVIGPVSKRTAKRSARKMSELSLICQSALAISIREYLGGCRGRS